MRNILIVPVVFGLGAAQAADTTLTLACQGTVTETMMEEEKKPEPISMGIIHEQHSTRLRQS